MRLVTVLRYRKNNTPQVEVDLLAFKQWISFIGMNEGELPPGGLVFVLTDQEQFHHTTDELVRGITQEYLTNDKEKKFTVSVIVGVGGPVSTKNVLMDSYQNPENHLNMVFITELCNVMYTKLTEVQKDIFCMSVGLTAGAAYNKIKYNDYHKQIQNIQALDHKPLRIFDAPSYENVKANVVYGPILRFK